jgi:zona occludens toxin (predicted ATPase)
MITLYRGSRGKGKTLTMTKDALKFFQRGFRVLTNLTSLKFGEKVSAEFILSLSRDSQLSNCVLVIDEIEYFFDSREWNSKGKKEILRQFSHFLQEIRKKNINILCTCQYISLVDIRIRQQIDTMVYPHFVLKLSICKVYYFDITKLEDDYSNINLSPTFVVYDAKPIFKLYNTFEMIK